ncbi:MAG TPA: ECF-type sigma factor [Dokdonella sp.]|uniref:ECF-type sigma factor n=1 Tax=Dokdonella sp. TaxID=2291710 RepID=UPI0025BE9DE3|nr:ECF-type sigma factor [Dokdonella sp.]MBX3690878.1 sigma-70 family RNA polymerase sigma factor [Dokdonella sp.]MCW5569146.1 sigma-70 family RNA polymerase sigma factor [Dokdonella sp.]HNR91394.1 ECF-type sigma factor [Dokdonella sp.]
MPGTTTELLQRWRAGEPAALDALLPQVYGELRRLAAGALGAHKGHATLQPTALLNEVFVRLLSADQVDLENRKHLFATAARIMRQILVDRARRAASDKHGAAWQRESFVEALQLPIPGHTDLQLLDAALEELGQANERMARVVELRYFVGLSVAEAAGVLEVEERTVYRDWALAKAWLQERLRA